jgi:hypothetical protein
MINFKNLYLKEDGGGGVLGVARALEQDLYSESKRFFLTSARSQ